MEKLPKYTHENGIDYVLVGDYYIPMLTLLEENRPGYYSSLLLTGKLWTYLADLDEQAQERLNRRKGLQRREYAVCRCLHSVTGQKFTKKPSYYV